MIDKSTEAMIKDALLTPHSILKETVQTNKELGNTISLSFSLIERDTEGDPNDPENWDVVMGFSSGAFPGVPDEISSGVFQMVTGLQHGFFKHAETVMEWAMHEMMASEGNAPSSATLN